MKVKELWLLLLIPALAACDAGSSTSQAIPTVVLTNNASSATTTPQPGTGTSVIASGVIAPTLKAEMAFTSAGMVKSVNVSVGETVQAGELLVQLDDTAQQIRLEQAKQTLLELTSAAAIASAQKIVAQDQQDLDNAQSNLNNQIYYSTNQDAIQNAKANLTLADNALSSAQKAYNNTPGNPDKDARKAYAYQNLYAAQQAYNAALYNYNWWTGKPNQEQIDMKTAQVALARAKLVEDQTLLAALTGGQVPDDATGSGYAQLRQARLNLQSAQHDLDATRLVAPFPGVIATANAVGGDYVSPGEIIIVISDVDHLYVETTDLSERDIPQVAPGQAATVVVKALKQNVPGRVRAVSPLADSLGGDVVYKVLIDLDQLPPGLRAGMSVEVLINTNQ
jgi:multidrug resistance efflux pump